MPIRPEQHYFGAGPAMLPTDAIAQLSSDIVSYLNNGIGITEISHRSADAVAVINDAKADLVKTLDIPDTHDVIFAQAGGTGGFAMVAYNMMSYYAYKHGKTGVANYLVTGAWSEKAAAEAKRIGFDVNIACDAKAASQNGKYGSIPPESQWTLTKDPKDIAYVYYCDNETVGGVEFPSVPNVPEGVDLVGDMSSNILSRRFDVSKFAIAFGGAQKNVGIAGVTFYIVRKDILDASKRLSPEEERKLGLPVAPIILDLPIIYKNNSLYNTLPIFCVRALDLCVRDVLNKGGLIAQEQESDSKAAKVYNVVDSYPKLYNCPIDKACRSKMNIVFTLPSPEIEKEFLQGATEKGLNGLKGHRSVGGIRVSNYNAVSVNSTNILVDYMTEFAKKHN